MMFLFLSTMNDMELPNLDGFDYDNQIPLISSIYKAKATKPDGGVAQDLYRCEENDDVRIKMVWPGTVTICHAEQISFEAKRENPSSKGKLIYLRGYCRTNGYGDIYASSKNNRDKKIEDKRYYEQIDKIDEQVISKFNGEVFCGKTLVNK